MYAHFFRKLRSTRRRAAALLAVMVLLPVLLGFAVLTVDVGVLFNTRADLQNAADAGALAATNVLASDRSAAGVARARQQAIEIIQRHTTLGRSLSVASSDMVFGRIDYDAESNSFDFTPTEIFPDSVRISMQAANGSSNGPVPLYFAAIFGKRTANVRASALAGLTGARDIAVVIDLSGSMKYDSDMRFYQDTQINIRDIWASLDGPPPSDTYLPGAEGDTEYATDTGPTIGVMSTWGNAVTTSYNPTTDPGLWYIPNNAPCAIGAITASLTARGYNGARRNAIMNSSSSTSWPNRVAVMIGVAEWTPSSGGDTSVGSTELTWIPYPSHRKNWTWAQFIDWVAGNDNRLTDDYSNFRFRFGLKTYTEFLLDRKYNFSETDLTGTPEEPMQSVKDGLREMVNITRSFDQMSLEVFATTARHEIDLTFDRESVADRLDAMQPNYYDSATNIGGGLQLAIDELTSVRARDDARPMVVLMSDGVSNEGPDPISVAEDAVALGIPVYTISVGAGADRAVLQEIAEMTGGQEFFAAGAGSEYTAELQGIFRTIGTMGFAALVE
jgi:Flp pilus assembly protein TadG